MRKRELREHIEWLEARESEHSQIVCDMQQRIDELEVRLVLLEANRLVAPFPREAWLGNGNPWPYSTLDADLTGWQSPPPAAIVRCDAKES